MAVTGYMGGFSERVVDISPAMNGNSSWNLDTQGALVFNGNANFTITAQQTFPVTATIWGGGAAGVAHHPTQGNQAIPGPPGGDTFFAGMTAGGGQAGNVNTPGPGGIATDGDENVDGNPGNFSNGGAAPDGGAGGGPNSGGASPGGGGGGQNAIPPTVVAKPGGGSGAKSKKRFIMKRGVGMPLTVGGGGTHHTDQGFGNGAAGGFRLE